MMKMSLLETLASWLSWRRKAPRSMLGAPAESGYIPPTEREDWIVVDPDALTRRQLARIYEKCILIRL